MRLFILYNLQWEIINFLYKNYRKAEGCSSCNIDTSKIILWTLISQKLLLD